VEGAIYFDLTDYRTHYPGTTDIGKFRRRIHGVFDMYGKAETFNESVARTIHPN
jgi:beta-galactosidase